MKKSERKKGPSHRKQRIISSTPLTPEEEEANFSGAEATSEPTKPDSSPQPSDIWADGSPHASDLLIMAESAARRHPGLPVEEAAEYLENW